MFYSEQVIDEVRSRTDIVDLIGSYVKIKRTGSNYQGLCPFHNEKSPSFSVSPARQTYKCFGCGKGGNVFTFLMEYENYSFPESLRFLAERAGVTLPEADASWDGKKKAEEKARLYEVYTFAARYFHQKLHEQEGKYAYDYLKNRKLSDSTITRFGLGYSDGHLYEVLKKEGYEDTFLSRCGLFTYTEQQGVRDKFWNRVMFPILDRNSKVIAFGGRVMGDAKPKYLNSPETDIFDKGQNLYGLHAARRTKKNYYLLCEGYVDTIALHQAGFDNAVASLGTSLTEGQARLLSRFTREVVITYDSDEAGQKASLRAIPILKEAGIRARILDMRPYKDPDEFIKALGIEAYEERIEKAEGSFFFEIRVLSGQFDMTDPEEKTKFYQAVARKMLDFSDELERRNYMEAFCREYFVAPEDFRKMVNRLGNQVAFQKNNEEVHERDRKELQDRSKPDKALLMAEKLLLTWCVNQPESFGKIDGILEPQDFEEGVYRDVAEMCFKQYREKGKAEPAGIISRFETKEEQSLAADICTTELHEELSTEERLRAFADTVIRIKTHSLDVANAKAVKENNAAMVLKLMKEKKELPNLRKRLITE